MVFPALTLWTLDGPPEESSDTENPPPIPPKPSAQEMAKAYASFGATRQPEPEPGSDDEEFFDTPMAEIEEKVVPDSSQSNGLHETPPSTAASSTTTIVQHILNKGRHTATFPGTSQYARGGSSACGLASMNAVRLAFEICSDVSDNQALISTLVGEDFVKNAMEIASFWPNEAHLEVEQILELPLFARSVQVTDVQYREARFRSFSDAVIALRSDNGTPGPRAVFITRPPEMISVMHIPVPEHPENSQQLRSFYLIFDSHPRPNHPDGTAVQIFPSDPTDDIADYLADLFEIDAALMNDPTLEWHVQLLGQVSCHFLAPVNIQESGNEYATNMAFLGLRQQLGDTKRKLDASEKEKRQLRSRVFDLEQEVAWLGNIERKKQEEIHQLRTRIVDKPHQPRSKDSTWSWSEPVKRSGKGKGRETQSTWDNSQRNGTQNTTSNFYDNNNWPKPQAKASSSSTAPSRARTLPAPGTPGPSGSRAQGVSPEEIEMTRSFELAMALQQEFDNERVTFAQDQTLAQAFERPKFDCAICMESFTDEAIALVDGCDHSCCRECMRSHVQSKIDERRYPILCPFCVVGPEDKDQAKANVGVISPLFVETLGVTPELFNIYVELQLAEHSIMIDCRRCSQSAFVDRKDLDLAEIIQCPMPRCTYTWCKQCNQTIEGGAKHSCDGSAELETLMNQRGWKHCPGCRTPIERSAGCNHMTCSTPSCNMHFCYICGGTVTRGGTRSEIQNAVASHFRSCALFDVPREAR